MNGHIDRFLLRQAKVNVTESFFENRAKEDIFVAVFEEYIRLEAAHAARPKLSEYGPVRAMMSDEQIAQLKRNEQA